MTTRTAPSSTWDDALVPLVYFNIVNLKAGEHFDYRTPGYETCVVPATGTVTVETAGETFAAIGNRGVDVWDGEPEGVYVPQDTGARITALTDTEIFIAGAKFAETLRPFAVRAGRYRQGAIRVGRHENPSQDQAHPWRGLSRPRRPPAGVRTVHRGRRRLVGLSQPQARHGPPAGRNPPRRMLQLPLPARLWLGPADAAAGGSTNRAMPITS